LVLSLVEKLVGDVGTESSRGKEVENGGDIDGGAAIEFFKPLIEVAQIAESPPLVDGEQLGCKAQRDSILCKES